MTFVSYAQNFEDVILMRAFSSVQNGSYIDVGAQDPNVDSVGKAFFERGWRGLHVEPSPYYAGLLREQRPSDLVIEAAIAENASVTTFFEIPHSGVSTTVAEVALRHRERGCEIVERQVLGLPLSAVLQQWAGHTVQWLKLDIEGAELNALASWGIHPLRPQVVVVESTLPMTQIPSYAGWEPLLLAKGYEFAYFDGLNRFYVHEAVRELKALIATPPNVFDDFELDGTANAPFHRGLTRRLKAETEANGQRLADAAARAEELARSWTDERAALSQAAERALEDARRATGAAKADMEAWQVMERERNRLAEEAAESRVVELGQRLTAALALVAERTSQLDHKEALHGEASLSSEALRVQLLTEQRTAEANATAWQLRIDELQRLSGEAQARHEAMSDELVAQHFADLQQREAVWRARHDEQAAQQDARRMQSEAVWHEQLRMERDRREAALQGIEASCSARLAELTALHERAAAFDGVRQDNRWRAALHGADARERSLRAAMERQTEWFAQAWSEAELQHARQIQQVRMALERASADAGEWVDRLHGANARADEAEAALRRQAQAHENAVWSLRAAHEDALAAAARRMEMLSEPPRGDDSPLEMKPESIMPMQVSLSPLRVMPSTLSELLELQDGDFVAAAYRVLLGREADPTGFEDYVRQVRAGVSQERIVVAMRSGDEGRRHEAQLTGLAELQQSYRLGRRGRLERFSRRLLGGALLPVETRLRALENRLYRAEQGKQGIGAEIVGKLATFECTASERFAKQRDEMHRLSAQFDALSTSVRQNELGASLDRVGQRVTDDVGEVMGRIDRLQSTIDVLNATLVESGSKLDALQAAVARGGAEARPAGSVPPAEPTPPSRPLQQTLGIGARAIYRRLSFRSA